MKILLAVLVVLSVVILAGCKTSASKAMIYDQDSKLLKTIDNQKTLTKVISTWKSKERALEKLLPLFEYKIEMDVDGEKQIWRFNKAGYLMQEGNSLLYKVKDRQVFSDLVD